jgi:hypothetical protein
MARLFFPLRVKISISILLFKAKRPKNERDFQWSNSMKLFNYTALMVKSGCTMACTWSIKLGKHRISTAICTKSVRYASVYLRSRWRYSKSTDQLWRLHRSILRRTIKGNKYCTDKGRIGRIDQSATSQEWEKREQCGHYLVATPRWVSGIPSSAAIPEAEVMPADGWV